MKTSLKVIALIIAAGTPVAAFAQSAGVSLPSSFNAETAVSLFVTTIIALLFVGDYSRRTRRLDLTQATVIVPTAGTFAKKPAAEKSESLAA